MSNFIRIFFSKEAARLGDVGGGKKGIEALLFAVTVGSPKVVAKGKLLEDVKDTKAVTPDATKDKLKDADSAPTNLPKIQSSQIL